MTWRVRTFYLGIRPAHAKGTMQNGGESCQNLLASANAVSVRDGPKTSDTHTEVRVPGRFLIRGDRQLAPSDNEARHCTCPQPVDNYVDSRHRCICRPSTDAEGGSRR